MIPFTDRIRVGSALDLWDTYQSTGTYDDMCEWLKERAYEMQKYDYWKTYSFGCCTDINNLRWHHE